MMARNGQRLPSAPAQRKSRRPKRMIRALVFDFDGLILDTETAMIDAYGDVHRARGVPFDRDLLRAQRRARGLRLRPVAGVRERARTGPHSRPSGGRSTAPATSASPSCPASTP